MKRIFLLLAIITPIWAQIPVAILNSCSPTATAPSGGYFNSTATFSGFTPAAATLTPNGYAAPDCSSNAAALTENTAAADHDMTPSTISHVFPGGTGTTVTIYAKQTVGNRGVRFNLQSSSFASGAAAAFDLSNCSVVSGSVFAFGTWSGTSNTGTAAVAPGWCKLVLTITVIGADTGINSLLEMVLAGTATTSYTGDGVSSIATWGWNFT